MSNTIKDRVHHWLSNSSCHACVDEIAKFVRKEVAREREACIADCEAEPSRFYAQRVGALACVDRIRARGRK